MTVKERIVNFYAEDGIYAIFDEDENQVVLVSKFDEIKRIPLCEIIKLMDFQHIVDKVLKKQYHHEGLSIINQEDNDTATISDKDRMCWTVILPSNFLTDVLNSEVE